MISRECKFSDFVGALRNKNYYEILQLADQEATEAERLYLRSRANASIRIRCGREYAERIKQLIAYMRYEVRPCSPRTRDTAIFAAINPQRRPQRGI